MSTEVARRFGSVERPQEGRGAMPGASSLHGGQATLRGVETLFIEPGSPWENGYNESFNGTLGEEVLKREIFYSLEEAKVLIEQWRREYNTIRPHSSLRYRPPAPEALRPDPFFLNLPKLNGPHPRLQEAVGLTQ